MDMLNHGMRRPGRGELLHTIGVTAALTGVILGAPRGEALAQGAAQAPLAMPAGVTLVDVSKGGDEVSNGFLWRRLGDAEGRLLYTFDKDGTTGQSSCFSDCAREFPPLMASRGAAAFGDWSLVSRPGEQGKQWAYRGRPLYHYAGHTVMPELGLSYDSVLEKGHEHDLEPSSQYFSPKLGWRQAVFDPTSDIPMPADVRLECVQAASGFAFVTASSGVPIYILNREPTQSSEWTPLYASSAALAVGDFSMVRRDDGTHQWAYKGQRLYTYNGDYSATDVNGLAQKEARVALAYRLFMPGELAMSVMPTRPPMMITAKGLSVYTEARYHLQYGGRETRGGYHYDYDDAKAVGTQACMGECNRTWVPVLAAPGAQSGGFWEVMTRPDGKRQWAYKGSALYTYADDKMKGDIKGNNKSVILYGDENDHIVTVLGEGFSSGARGAQSSDLLSLAGGKVNDPNSYYGASFGAGFYWHLVPLFN